MFFFSKTCKIYHVYSWEVSCLKQGNKMNGFCLCQSQGWKVVGVHPTPIFIHLRNTLNTKVYYKQCRFLL